MDMKKDMRSIRNKNLLALIDEKYNGSQQLFSERTGISLSQIGQWLANPDNLNSRNMTEKSARRIEEACGVKSGSLDLDEKEEIIFVGNDEFDFVKFVCIKVTAGISGFAVNYLNEDEYEPIYFKKSWFTKRNYNPAALYATTVRGKSMEPTLTQDSIIIINTHDTAMKNEDLYVFNYHGEPVVKRLIKDFGGWYLSSDNPDKANYPRVLCDENTFIVGRVVHAQSEYF